MAERKQPGLGAGEPALLVEITRQNKIIRALMNRAERSSMDASGSDFGLFQTTILLEDQVRRRTAELEKALRENEKVTRALRESEARFRGVVNQPLVGIAIIEDGKFTFTNSKLDGIFGYSAEEIRALGPIDMAIEEDRHVVAENLYNRVSGKVKFVDYTFRARRKDGAVADIELHSCAMDIDGKRMLVSVVMDITERVRAERQMQAMYTLLREQSIRDSLTGLYNRRYLDATLERELVLAQRTGRPVSVVMCDFDHFKTVNDQHGHLAGDEVLRIFGGLLTRTCRGSDIPCRYGGEEFVLVLPGMSAEKAREHAETLRTTVQTTPVHHDGAVIAVTASLGIASFPRDAKNGTDLLAAADQALYAAKRGGRNQVRTALESNSGNVAPSRRLSVAAEA